MTSTRPVVTSRFPWASLWLLVLLPGNGVVLFDLAHHVVRPGVWLARFVPAFLVLAVVAWAQLGKSPFALRLRKELRLAQLAGLLLLLSSGLGLWSDVLQGSAAWRGLVHTLPWVLLFVLPAATVMIPMTVEQERGTLAGLLSSPLGARAFAEKFAVAAGLVVISWSQLIAADAPSREAWWFAFLGHVVALATVPTWFFFMRKEGTTLGAATIVPMLVAAPAGFFEQAGPLAASVAVYAVLMLALLPRAVRRGVMAPTLDDQLGVGARTLTPRLVPPLIAAELNAQREAVVLALVGVLGFFGVLALNGTTEASMTLFMPCAIGAALSPGLAFAESQRTGTLEALLVMRTRRSVFLLKALASLAVTMVACGVLPVALLLVAGVQGSPSDSFGWLLAMVFVWAVGLVAAVHTTGAAHATGAAVGVAFIGFVILMLAFGLVSLVLGSMLDSRSSGGGFVAAVFAGTAGIAILVAWRRFVLLPDRPVRGALWGAGASLFHATALGVAAALSGL